MKRKELEQLINQIMVWDDDYSGERILIDRRKLRDVIIELKDSVRKWQMTAEREIHRVEELYDRIDELKAEVREARHEAADWQMKYWNVFDAYKKKVHEREVM